MICRTFCFYKPNTQTHQAKGALMADNSRSEVREKAVTCRLDIYRDNVPPVREESYIRFRSDRDNAGPHIFVGPLKIQVIFFNKAGETIGTFDASGEIPEKDSRKYLLEKLKEKLLEPYGFKMGIVTKRTPSSITFNLEKLKPEQD
jgi:hypothetical protein